MPNRLATSTSPYLRQHADNPVDWWEWGDDAFAEAAERDVPVLLSVGYSSCHWCHVMAHESFEDDRTAEVMNAGFVNVKVDREERPDVDAVYMEAVQALTGRGGWPMTVWMTPDRRPFHAGTYFPKNDHHGIPAFTRVLDAITRAWAEDRSALVEQAGKLTEALARELPASGGVDRQRLISAYEQIAATADPINGGFGGAPKFPQAPVLEFLLRVADEPWAPQARPILRQAMVRMARGGIYDHVTGGFARYSVDDEWLVPHFEKMLYDNAQLARIYLRAGQVLGDRGLWQITREVLDYLGRDLRHPDGGYYSAQDADSEGVEGRFAVFTLEEFVEATGPDADIAARVLGVTEEGNFEGSNVLHRERSHAEVAEQVGITPGEVEAAMGRALEGLRSARARRTPPALDDKVVTSWNGLTIRALAESGAVLGDDGYLADARRCARFVLDNLVGAEGRLLRSWSNGMAVVPAFLEDHAAMAVGLLALYQATGEQEWFDHARLLVGEMDRLFADPDGASFTAGGDAEQLIVRKKDQMDNPSPSGNSLAAEAYLLMHAYTGDARHLDAARRIVEAGSLLVDRYPSAVGHLLAVATSMESGVREVAITGPAAHELAGVVWEAFRPGAVLAVDTDGSGDVPLLDHRFVEGETLAYVCEGFVCDAPVTSAEELRALLDS